MREFVLSSPHFLRNFKHFTASFTNFEQQEVYWADQCQCGSKVDPETHQCLALKEKRNGNQTSGF